MTHRNEIPGLTLVQGLGTHMRSAGRRLGAVVRRPFTRARGDGGASAVEYGLLVAAIAAVVVVVVFALGKVVHDKFQDTCTHVAGTNATLAQTCDK